MLKVGPNMKYYFNSLLIITLCYGIGLYSPATSAKVVQSYNHAAVRNYLNSRGKKSVRDMYIKFEKQLPSRLYEKAMKETSGANANVWFDSAKMGSNYAYVRIGRVKLFARATTDKGRDVILLNGEKITENDFRNLNALQAKIYKAYVKEIYSKKGLFSSLFGFKAFAGNQEIAEDTPDVIVGGNAPKNDECATANAAAVGADDKAISPTEDKAIMDDLREKCNLPIPPTVDVKEFNDTVNQCIDPVTQKPRPDAPAECKKKNNSWLWILLGLGVLALLLFLLMKKKKDKKEPGETPELDCTKTPKPAGCPDDRPNPDGSDPENPIIDPVNPDPQPDPEPEPEVEVPESTDPSGRDSGDNGDPAEYNPTYKTKARVKTKK